MGEHDGRVALITGGSSGIGRAVAVRLAGEGAAVAVSSADRAEATALAELITRSGGMAHPAIADVTDAAAVRSAVAGVVERFGRLDILVASAGIQRYGDVADTSEQTWDEVFAVNVKGVFLAAQACIPHLRSSGTGAVVIVSSVQASAAQARVVAYAASKGALTSFARALAVDEAPHGVRVNAVCPGSVDTPMLRASAALLSGVSADSTLAGWGSAHPLGRVARPDEIAAAVSFLASDRASFITGEDLRVDGGLLATLPAALPD